MSSGREWRSSLAPASGADRQAARPAFPGRLSFRQHRSSDLRRERKLSSTVCRKGRWEDGNRQSGWRGPPALETASVICERMRRAGWCGLPSICLASARNRLRIAQRTATLHSADHSRKVLLGATHRLFRVNSCGCLCRRHRKSLALRFSQNEPKSFRMSRTGNCGV